MQRYAEGEVVAPHAAVLLRERQAEQTELPDAGNEFVGEFVTLIESADHGSHCLASELHHGPAQGLMLIVETEADHASDATWRHPEQR
jgi:hypothetical protein